jgi:hypothetical protein
MFQHKMKIIHMDKNPGKQRRERIIDELHEPIHQIDKQIEKLYQDKDLYSSIIQKLYRKISEKHSNSEEESSIEIVQLERALKPIKIERRNKKTKAEERQEAFCKAKAWALDRTQASKK